METFSVFLALCEGNSPVAGGFPLHKGQWRGVLMFFYLRLKKRMSKQSRRRLFETPSLSLWRHCNAVEQLVKVNIKERIKGQHCWPFVKGIHRWPRHSPHKGSVMQIRFLYHNISMIYHWSLQWRHNERYGVSNHQPHDCLFYRLFRRRSKKTSKLRVTGLCVRDSPVTGEFPAHMASNAKMFPFDDVIMLIKVSLKGQPILNIINNR